MKKEESDKIMGIIDCIPFSVLEAIAGMIRNGHYGELRLLFQNGQIKKISNTVSRLVDQEKNRFVP